MKNSYDFGEPSGGGFIDTHFDFARCQRPDGSFYGTSGQCRKGSPAGAKDIAEAPAAPFRTRPKAAIESDMKKLASSGAMQEKGKAGRDARARFADLKAELKKPLLKDPVAAVAKQQKANKDFLKEDNKRIAKENPQIAMRFNKNKIKKLGNEYERLRGDATQGARRRQIIDEVDKLVKQNNALQKKMDDATKSQSPRRAPDTSPAAGLRRTAAAMRAKD